MLNRSIVNEALKAQPGCLTPEELEKLAAAPQASHPHLLECPHCQSELAMLKVFESSEPIPGEGAAVAWISNRLEQRLDQIKHPDSRRAAKVSGETVAWYGRLFGGGRWLLPATAALVVAVTSVLLMHHGQEPQLNADAGNGPAIYRSQEVAAVGPAGEVAEAPNSMQWKAFPGAAKYKAEIMEVDETLLWSGETSDVNLTIPATVRGKMLPGKPVLWRVTALNSQGQILAASQVQHFSVQRKSSSSTSGVLPR